MPAKQISEWEVIAGATTEAAAQELVDLLGGKAFATMRKIDTFVCPHAECGAPWPLSPGTNEPVNAAGYLLLTSLGLAYCCAETAEDCETNHAG